MIKKSICVLVAFLLTRGVYMNPRANNNNINNEIYSEKTDFQELGQNRVYKDKKE